MTKKREIKELISKFAADSTTHGVAPVVQSESNSSRWFSVALLIFLFVSVSYSITSSIRNFLQYDTVTSVSVKHYNKLQFPSVTICPNTNLPRKYTPDTFKGMIEDKLKETEASGNYSDMHIFMRSILLPLRAAMENSNFETPNKPPWIPADIPGSCYFAGSVRCNFSEDFKRHEYAPNHAGCYTFNSGINAKYYQKGNGAVFGLTMVLYVNQSDYLPLSGNSKGAGFTIYLNRPDTPHNLVVEGILVSPGQITAISVAKRETVLKPAPYPSKCSDGKGNPYHFTGQYQEDTCKYICANDNVFKKCGYASRAIKAVMKNVKNQNTTVEMLKCEFAVLQDALANGSDCNCPEACVKDHFLPLVSSSSWPTEADLPALKTLIAHNLNRDVKNVTNDFARRNFAKVMIYYEKLSVQRIVESPMYSSVGLISQIGGLLGLWIGSSLYSVAQAFAMLFGIFYILLRRTPAKNSVETDNV